MEVKRRQRSMNAANSAHGAGRTHRPESRSQPLEKMELRAGGALGGGGGDTESRICSPLQEENNLRVRQACGTINKTKQNKCIGWTEIFTDPLRYFRVVRFYLSMVGRHIMFKLVTPPFCMVGKPKTSPAPQKALLATDRVQMLRHAHVRRARPSAPTPAPPPVQDKELESCTFTPHVNRVSRRAALSRREALGENHLAVDERLYDESLRRYMQVGVLDETSNMGGGEGGEIIVTRRCRPP